MEMFHLFSSSRFMPHGHCYYWEPYLLWSHALSDGIIALAYCAIPLTLFYIYLKRKQDFQYLWMAVLFAVFILGCGVTHVFDVITIWNPLYYADSVVRIITAAASVATALVLVRITPQLLLIPSANQWQTAQAALEAQVEALYQKDQRLQVLNEELTTANEELQATHEELRANYEQLQRSNQELLQARLALEQLNQQLERRVTERTEQLQAAQAKTERQRSELFGLFMQAPAGIALLKGPDLIYQMANPTFLEIVGRTSAIVGKPGREVFPEAVAQGIWDLMEGVYRSGEPYVGKEFKALLDLKGTGELKTQYYDFVFQPVKDDQQQTEALLVTALDVTHQVEARKLVEENALRFQTLLESIPQMAWSATATGELAYFNTQWYAYTGQSQAQALGNGWTRVTHPEDVALVLPFWQHALATGTPYQVECRYRRASDQTYRWHLTRAVPLRSETGEITGWVGTCTEIHAQKLYAQQLLERETYFRQMADKVPVMIWVTDPQGQCSYLNKPWYEYTGQTQPQALGLGWTNATHPEDVSPSREALLLAINKQTPFGQLYRLRSKEGTYRWFFDKGEPRYDEQGNFEGFVGVVIDVHEQHQAEERLQLSVKAGKVGIFEWDVVRNRATYSDLLLAMFGLEAGTFGGEFDNAYQVFQSVIHPQDRQQVNEQVEKALRNGETEFYVEFRVVRPGGEIAWIAERGEAVFEGATPVRMNGACTDITSRKQAEETTQRMAQEIAAANEELRTANEEIQAANEELSESNQTLARMNAALDQTNQDLERTNKDLDTFVYTASHDLKAPILNIEGLLKALEKQLGKETLQQTRVQQMYELLYKSVNRFKSTIGDLTEVARIGKESTEDVAHIDIGDMLKEVLADLEMQLQEAGVRLEHNVECPAIQFSRKNLKSILYNLLSNAIKYRSPDRQPLVRITCQMQAGYTLLTVQDNGLGMDMRHEEKIFALFKRLHSHVEGSGIGLYIVKKMIEHAEGKIAVESQVGVGSTFSVYFKR